MGKDGPEYLVHDPAAGVAPLPLRPRSRYMYALRVLEPIETAGMTLQDVGALRDRVRDLIIRTRAELQQELGIGAQGQ